MNKVRLRPSRFTLALLWLFSVGLLSLYAAVITAGLKKHFHLESPFWWLLVFPAAATLVAALLGVGRIFRTKAGGKVSRILVTASIATVPMIYGGGIYSYPIARFLGSKKWISSLLLCLGLAVTVFGFGFITHSTPAHSLIVYLPVAAVVLTFRAVRGSAPLDMHNFGVLHIVALFAAMAVAVSEDAQRRKASRVSTGPHTSEATANGR